MRLPAFPIFVRVLFALMVLTTPDGIHAQSTASPATTPPPRALFLIRGPDGIVTAIRAVSVQQQGAVLLIVNANGGRAMVQARTVVGQLPWFTDEEIESGAVDPVQLAAKYDAFASRLPASQRKFLSDEAARFRAVQTRGNATAAAKRNAAEARIQSVTATIYDPASAYSVEVLEALLQAADVVRGEDPAAAERIDLWAAPFREHLANLKAGSRYENGTWVTKEDLERRTRAAREAEFLKSLDAPSIAARALPADVVHGIATKAAVGAGIAALAGAGLVFALRRRPVIRLAGIALLVGGPVAVGALFFLATRNPDGLPSATPPAELQPLITLLGEAAGLGGDAPLNAHAISEAAINTFLTRHVSLARHVDRDAWAANREGLAVRLQPDRASIFELIRCAGRSWIVRYDLSLPKPGGNSPLVVSGVKIGALDCPVGLARQLWSSLEPQLTGVLTTLRLNDRFVVQGGSDGAIQIAPKNSPPAPASTPAPVAPPSPPAAAPTATTTPGMSSVPAGENSPIQSPGPRRNEEPAPSPTP